MAEKKKAPRGSEFWQIIFPAVFGTVLILAVGVWFGITGSTGNLSRFAEISLVLLSFPFFIASLLFGLILIGLIFLVSKMIQGIPPVTGRVLEFLDKIREGTVRGTRSLASLVIEPIALFGFIQRKPKQQDSEIKLND
jgi:hypothetical protein